MYRAQKSPARCRADLKVRLGVGVLGFDDFAGFDRLDAAPHALDFTAGELDAYALYVGAEATLGVFDQAGTDAAALFGETFTDDASAFYGALACDCANSCHGKFLFLVKAVESRVWGVAIKSFFAGGSEGRILKE